MSAILKFDFQKRKQLRFSEVNYLNYKNRPNFPCGNYIFPKTRGNKNKPWTHSTPLNSAPTCVWFLETKQKLILEEGNKLAQLWPLSHLAKSLNSYTQ